MRFCFDIIYGVIPRPKQKEKLSFKVSTLWKSKNELAGHRKNTNSEFVEFLLYRGNSVSSARDRNSNMKRREEMCLELDDGSSGSGSSKFLATFLV